MRQTLGQNTSGIAYPSSLWCMLGFDMQYPSFIHITGPLARTDWKAGNPASMERVERATKCRKQNWHLKISPQTYNITLPILYFNVRGWRNNALHSDRGSEKEFIAICNPVYQRLNSVCWRTLLGILKEKKVEFILQKLLTCHIEWNVHNEHFRVNNWVFLISIT